MQKQMLIYICLTIAYSGALLHSFVPHHHHASLKEAKTHHHHHHDHGKAHSHDDGKDKEDQPDKDPYFFTHSGNADVLVNDTSSEKTVKSSKVVFASLLTEIVNSFYSFKNTVFHPPQNDRLQSRLVHISFSLRGPPSIA